MDNDEESEDKYLIVNEDGLQWDEDAKDFKDYGTTYFDYESAESEYERNVKPYYPDAQIVDHPDCAHDPMAYVNAMLANGRPE